MNEKEYYREQIIEMIQKCNDLHWIKTIYAYLSKLLK